MPELHPGVLQGMPRTEHRPASAWGICCLLVISDMPVSEQRVLGAVLGVQIAVGRQMLLRYPLVVLDVPTLDFCMLGCVLAPRCRGGRRVRPVVLHMITSPHGTASARTLLFAVEDQEDAALQRPRCIWTERTPPCTTPAYGWTRPTVHAHRATVRPTPQRILDRGTSHNEIPSPCVRNVGRGSDRGGRDGCRAPGCRWSTGPCRLQTVEVRCAAASSGSLVLVCALPVHGGRHSDRLCRVVALAAGIGGVCCIERSEAILTGDPMARPLRVTSPRYRRGLAMRAKVRWAGADRKSSCEDHL
jgi:hypothetical protein